MYVAVTNLGAGGTEDVALSDTSNAVLYAMFSITGLVSGGINNCTYSYSADGLMFIKSVQCLVLD